MSTDYGKKIGKAFEAIGQLYSDTSKLLSECDDTIGKDMTSVFGNKIMPETSKSVHNPDSWIRDYVYRYYDAAKYGNGLLDGIICNFCGSKTEDDEPTLVLGRIKYQLRLKDKVDSKCKYWDLASAASEWSDDKTFDKPIRLDNLDDDRIEWVVFLITPLYSIKSMKRVQELMEEVRSKANEGAGMNPKLRC